MDSVFRIVLGADTRREGWGISPLDDAPGFTFAVGECDKDGRWSTIVPGELPPEIDLPGLCRVVDERALEDTRSSPMKENRE